MEIISALHNDFEHALALWDCVQSREQSKAAKKIAKDMDMFAVFGSIKKLDRSWKLGMIFKFTDLLAADIETLSGKDPDFVDKMTSYFCQHEIGRASVGKECVR